MLWCSWFIACRSQVISAWVCISLYSSDHTIPERWIISFRAFVVVVGVEPKGFQPADCPHQSHYHCRLRLVVLDTRMSQHTPKVLVAPKSRRPPQSNYPPDSVPLPDDGSRLDSKRRKGGISPLAPRSPKASVQSLPPILRIQRPKSLSSYSKGPRGLSV